MKITSYLLFQAEIKSFWIVVLGILLAWVCRQNMDPSSSIQKVPGSISQRGLILGGKRMSATFLSFIPNEQQVKLLIGSFVEYKKYSITWHYRLADPDYGVFQANECRLHLENSVLTKLPVDVMVGKKNLEVRPSSMNKGEIVKKLVSKYSDCEFIICAGGTNFLLDDRTDEDMFKVLQKYSDREFVFTVTIGSPSKRTRATSHVTCPTEIISLLHGLAYGKLEN